MKYRISGVIDLIPESQDAQIAAPTLTPETRGAHWYKSRSDSVLKPSDNGFVWSPVRKPTTVHTYHAPADFSVGKIVTYNFKWKSDGMDGSNSDIDGSANDWSGQGRGISDDYLRCLAGTGDFRLGFFEAGDPVYDNSTEGPDADNPALEFNDYKGFQVRWHPHLSRGFSKLPGRLKEDKGRESENHNNLTLWSRVEKGRFGLMSDEAQKHEHSGFSKSDGAGTQPVSWGAESPFGDWIDVSVRAERVTREKYTVTFSAEGRDAPLLVGNFSEDFAPEKLDCMAITYTNQSRRYKYVELADLICSNI